jgi:hypothetical protein
MEMRLGDDATTRMPFRLPALQGRMANEAVPDHSLERAEVHRLVRGRVRRTEHVAEIRPDRAAHRRFFETGPPSKTSPATSHLFGSGQTAIRLVAFSWPNDPVVGYAPASMIGSRLAAGMI